MLRLSRKMIYVGVGMLLLLSIVFLNHSIAKAEDQADESRVVRVSAGVNKALYIDESGKAAGYCTEYLDQIAKINNWKLEYVNGSWTEQIDNLKNGKIDLLFPTQMTDEREEYMSFSSAIGGYQPIGIFANSDSDLCYEDYEGFNGAKIAVSKGTSNETALKKYAQDNHFQYTTVYLDSTEDKIKALEDGSVDLMVFSTLNDVDSGKVVAMIDYLPFYYCTRKEDSNLMKKLNFGMNQILLRKPSLVENVFNRFLGTNTHMAYTKEEKRAIDKKGKITVGVYVDTPPLFSVNNDGSFRGIYVDLVKRIERISGIEIEMKAIDRKEYAYDYLDRGDIDFILGSSSQALEAMGEKANRYVKSNGILDYYSVAITKQSYVLDKGKKIKFALTKGRTYWETMIMKEYPFAEITYCENDKDCLEAVQRNDADITILNTWEYNYQSKNERFQKFIEWESTRTLSDTIFVSESDSDKLLVSVLDKAIDQISGSEKEKIIAANLNVGYEDYDIFDRIYAARESIIFMTVIALVLGVGLIIYSVMKKQNIKALIETNKQLAKANDAKNGFLSRMSHELRTPLNAISGYAALLDQSISEEKLDVEQTRNGIESIQRAVRYQLTIITDILDMLKMESGKIELKHDKIETAGFIRNIVEMVKTEARDKKIKFTYRKLSQMGHGYYVDGVRLQQVLLNILYNAVKFTPDGGKVKMTTEIVDRNGEMDTIKIVVSDNGIGMSDEFRNEYLFKAFEQEHKGSTSPYEGCGIGLSLSKEIINKMGGEITCESQKDKGSVFTIEIALKRIDEPYEEAMHIMCEKYDLSGVRVLICEDNKMNQDMESRLLEKVNCEVDVACDGEEGLKAFENSQVGFYDVILMDIRMPNMDGWECTEKIRALDREDAKTIPIFAVSANAFDDDISHSKEVGMTEHLAKPIDIKILYEKIKQY